MLPNDVLKRPGRHHAYEVDVDWLARLRAALAVLESVGVAEPLADVLSCTAAEILDGDGLSLVEYACGIGENFGLRYYGPMLECAGLGLRWGEPLFRERDSRAEPISTFWADRRPYLPQRVAPAAAIVESLRELREPPAQAWAVLHDEMFDEEAEADLPPEERTPALIARWRGEYIAELDVLERHVREIAARGGSVVTWLNEQGWL